MPKFLVRRERCTPYELVVEAADEDAAERVAYDHSVSEWNEQSSYWQDLQTEETDEEADLVDEDYEAEDEEDEEGEE